jgi:hypothetical protein
MSNPAHAFALAGKLEFKLIVISFRAQVCLS